jgi:hypothetical protein
VPCTSSPCTRSSSTLTTSKSSSTTSSKMLPVLVSRSALEMRVSTSLHQSSPSSTSTQSVLTSTSSQLPAFSREGPLGDVGESISVTELSNRSRPLVRLFAMNSLSEGTKKIYSLNWQLFVNFGALHGVNVNLYDWDFSFCCEFCYFVFKTLPRSTRFYRLVQRSISFGS